MYCVNDILIKESRGHWISGPDLMDLSIYENTGTNSGTTLSSDEPPVHWCGGAK